MRRRPKTKQIIINLDKRSYDRIIKCAELEHIGLEMFVRQIILFYIESYTDDVESSDEEKGGVRQ